MRRIPFIGGKTHTAAALNLLRTEVFQERFGDRISVPNFAVIVTGQSDVTTLEKHAFCKMQTNLTLILDGNSNIDDESTLDAAAQLRATGTQVIVVPIGETFTNMAEIEGMASEPVDKMIIGVDRFSQLPQIVMNITEGLCNGEYRQT